MKKKRARRFYIGDWRVDGNMRIRDYFAAMMAQGLVSNPDFDGDIAKAAEDAVNMAEALLGELSETGRYRSKEPMEDDAEDMDDGRP